MGRKEWWQDGEIPRRTARRISHCFFFISPPSRESRSEHGPSHLLEEMVATSAVKEVAQQKKRPTSSHSCHSGEEETLSILTGDQVAAAEKTRASPASVEAKEGEKVRSSGDGGIGHLDSGNCSQAPPGVRRLSHPEQNGSKAPRPVSREGHTTDGAGAPSGASFVFLAVGTCLGRSEEF